MRWDGMTILWDCFSPCERRQEWGSSRLHWIGPFSTVCTPEITPLAWEDNIGKFQHLPEAVFLKLCIKSHLFRGDVVHRLLVTATTKGSERKIASGHMVESHLIEGISRICICEGADIDCQVWFVARSALMMITCSDCYTAFDELQTLTPMLQRSTVAPNVLPTGFLRTARSYISGRIKFTAHPLTLPLWKECARLPGWRYSSVPYKETNCWSSWSSLAAPKSVSL